MLYLKFVLFRDTLHLSTESVDNSVSKLSKTAVKRHRSRPWDKRTRTEHK